MEALPQWFLEMSCQEIELAKIAICQSSVVQAYAVDQSWLDGEPHRQLNRKFLEYCRHIANLPKPPKDPDHNPENKGKSIIFKNVPFGWIEIHRFCRDHDIVITDGKKTGDIVQIWFQSADDAKQALNTLHIGLWSDESEIV